MSAYEMERSLSDLANRLIREVDVGRRRTNEFTSKAVADTVRGRLDTHTEWLVDQHLRMIKSNVALQEETAAQLTRLERALEELSGQAIAAAKRQAPGPGA